MQLSGESSKEANNRVMFSCSNACNISAMASNAITCIRPAEAAPAALRTRARKVLHSRAMQGQGPGTKQWLVKNSMRQPRANVAGPMTRSVRQTVWHPRRGNTMRSPLTPPRRRRRQGLTDAMKVCARIFLKAALGRRSKQEWPARDRAAACQMGSGGLRLPAQHTPWRRPTITR